MSAIRFKAALVSAKITKLLIKLFRMGSGYTWPGHVALKISPTFLNSPVFNFKRGVIVVAGTNGKTTTAKLCQHILQNNGYSVVHNKTGGNILNGIVSSIVDHANIMGKFDYDFGVFEVDEFVLPQLLKYIQPKVLILLNLSRDQLDRYGEIDLIVEKWLKSLEVNPVDHLVLARNEKHFAYFENSYTGTKHFFDSNKTLQANTTLLGDFNAKNINAAATACSLLGLPMDNIAQSLKTFSAAYGRGEIFEYFGNFYQVFLAKNPASFNNNLDILIYSEQKEAINVSYDSILFVLNDEVRDGRDVSWIYDINPVKLAKACKDKNVFISGTRSYDMALRLQYAGVPVSIENTNASLKRVIDKIHEQDGKEVVVLPNYSAMLQFRKLTLGKEIL
jgi:UDP-N-acetylmuramyl tripeptide synthase